MIDHTDAYAAAITGDSRRMHIRAIIDLISPDIVYGTLTSTARSTYCKPAQIYDKEMDAARYATLERSRWLLDGSYNIYPDAVADLTDEVGFQSNAQSTSSGAVSSFYVKQAFTGVDFLQAVSVYFPDAAADGVAKNFTMSIYVGSTVAYTQTVTGNTAAAVHFSGFGKIASPTAIYVKVTAWTLPYRRTRVIEIVPGVFERWGEEMISALSVKQQVNFACTALPYGTAELTIDNADRRFEPRNKDGVFDSITERQAVAIKIGPELPSGVTEWVQAGVFYQFSGGWKTGDNGLTITWDLVDIIGLLADRDYIVPDTLPTTLSGWLANIVAQLGVNFANRWRCNADYADVAVTARSASDLSGKKCGEVLRYACMAAGCYPFADAATGYLSAEPLWSNGGSVTLDNLTAYPTMKANSDLGYIQFTLNDGSSTQYRIGGNSSASSQTLSIRNPFIQTQAAALAAAKKILACYGGNQIEISGRGDPASECGDVDSIQLSESAATSARRQSQTFSFSSGVMQNLPAVFLQADGSYLFNERVSLTGSGTWTAPSGVTELFIILVGGGNGGEKGTDGTDEEDGERGDNGLGGNVFAATVTINDGQSISYACGAGGAANGGKGGSTTFATYSSANGKHYDGYTDVRSGDVYARGGIKKPLEGSGDGGKGGKAGRKSRTTKSADGKSEHTSKPTEGGDGVAGQSGCIVIWYATEDSTI